MKMMVMIHVMCQVMTTQMIICMMSLEITTNMTMYFKLVSNN
jgi:hypothetical protein